MSETTDKSATESKPQAIEDLLARDNQARLEGLRKQVTGKFIRLLCVNEIGGERYIRSTDIESFYDVRDSGFFRWAIVYSKGVNFRIKQSSEELLDLIALTEGEYSNSDLRDVLQSFFIAAGLPAAESQALLAPGNQSALALKCAEIVERLSGVELRVASQVAPLRAAISLLLRELRITRELSHHLSDLADAVREATRRAADLSVRANAIGDAGTDDRQYMVKHYELLAAAVGVCKAIGITDENYEKRSRHLGSDHAAALMYLQFSAEEIARRDQNTIRLGDEIRRLEDEIRRLEKDLATQTEKSLQTDTRLREVMAAAGELCRAHGIDDQEFDQEAFLGVDYYGATVRLLKRCAEQVAQLKSEAADSLKACDELSRSLSERDASLSFAKADRQATENAYAAAQKQKAELSSQVEALKAEAAQLREKHEASVTARMLVEQSGADAYQHQQAQITALKEQVAQQLGQMADDRGELLKMSEEIATLRQRLSVYEPGEVRS